MKTILQICFVFLLATASLRAAFTLYVDTATEEYYFSGSGVVNMPAGKGTIGAVEWKSGTPSGPSDRMYTVNPASYSFSPTTTVLDEPRFIDVGLTDDVTPLPYIFFVLVVDPGGTFTVTFNPSAKSSYAGLSQPYKDIFFEAALTGVVLTETFVGGNPTITMALASVPEPSTYAALAGLSILGLAVLRRRRA